MKFYKIVNLHDNTLIITSGKGNTITLQTYLVRDEENNVVGTKSGIIDEETREVKDVIIDEIKYESLKPQIDDAVRKGLIELTPLGSTKVEGNININDDVTSVLDNPVPIIRKKVVRINDVTTLNLLAEAEKAGKDRKTVANAIESRVLALS